MLDFESDASAASIVPGQRLEDVYADYGVSLSVLDDGVAIAFDSSDPNGNSIDNDPDLGTPNESYGGPGKGNSGESNTVAQHNLLICAEDLDDADNDGILDDPDDRADGATFHFEFDTPVCLDAVVLIDIDDSETVEFTVTHAGGQDPEMFVVDGMGNNSRVDVDFELELDGDGCEVSALTLELSASGGIDDLGFCYTDCEEGSGSGSNNACPLLVECVHSCADDDMACADACLLAGSEVGVAEAQALLTCIDANDCADDDDDDDCIEDNCGVEAFHCGHGPATCAGVAGCVEQCGIDEDSADSCVFGGTTLAQAQYEALQACADDNACQDFQCLEQLCAAELYTCTSGLSDDYPCPAAADCILQCNSDPVCELYCGPIATQTQAEVDAIVDCAQIIECDALACTMEACPQQWGECISGDQTCMDALACHQSCFGDALCEFNCFSGAQIPDLFFLDSLLVCIETEGCEDQACIEDKCGAPLEMCQNP